MDNTQAERLLKDCLREMKRAEDRMDRAELGSLGYSEASGREYGFQYVAETIASWSEELGQAFDKTVSELWSEGPTR